MSAAADTLARGLERLLPTIVPGATALAGLRRLSAGATLETWSFDALDTAGACRHALILRRSPGGLRSSESVPLAVEAQLLRALAGSGVPVPGVVHTLVPADELGDGFLMTRIEEIPPDTRPDEASLRELCRTVDARRAEYIRRLYGADWLDAANYDLSIDTSRIDAETVADLLEITARRRALVGTPAPR